MKKTLIVFIGLSFAINVWANQKTDCVREAVYGSSSLNKDQAAIICSGAPKAVEELRDCVREAVYGSSRLNKDQAVMICK
jgi:hypothetical protein